MKSLTLKLPNQTYPILIQRNLKDNLTYFLNQFTAAPGSNLGQKKSKPKIKPVAVITSPRVYCLYKDLFTKNFSGKQFKIIVTADGEKAKSPKWFFSTLNSIASFDRLGVKPLLICLGGGTVGDLGGFVASVYRRGIDYIQVPTTLIGQIDSSIGGKTAVNLTQAKNMAGTFYQPKAVLIDPEFLETLPKKNLKEGLAEAIKYGLICNQNLFFTLKNNSKQIISLDRPLIDHLIETCAAIKAKIVSQDEKEEKGIRTLLNFGHTLAHGLETASGYQKFSHGKAVAIGMLFAAHLSEELNYTKSNLSSQVEAVLNLFNLPVKARFNPETTLKSMLRDKKFTEGKVKMVLLREIGKAEVFSGIKLTDLKKGLKKIKSGN